MVHLVNIYIYIYMCGLSLLITVAADGLAPNGARPSAATVVIENDNFSV